MLQQLSEQEKQILTKSQQSASFQKQSETLVEELSRVYEENKLLKKNYKEMEGQLRHNQRELEIYKDIVNDKQRLNDYRDSLNFGSS